MRKTVFNTILAGLSCCTLFALLSLASCDNENEVVPITKENASAKRYKLPDPVLLTPEESAEVQRMRDEYRQATN